MSVPLKEENLFSINCEKPPLLSVFGIGVCPTRSEIDLLSKSMKSSSQRGKSTSSVKYFLLK